MNDTSDPIDVYVGGQMRDRRIALNLNQSDLGRALGVTFQQVQKYEKGANRVSASMMWRAAAALGCKPGDFFPVGDWMPAGMTALPMHRRGMGQIVRALAGLNEARFTAARKIVAVLAAEDPIETPAELLTEKNSLRERLGLPALERLP